MPNLKIIIEDGEIKGRIQCESCGGAYQETLPIPKSLAFIVARLKGDGTPDEALHQFPGIYTCETCWEPPGEEDPNPEPEPEPEYDSPDYWDPVDEQNIFEGEN